MEQPPLLSNTFVIFIAMALLLWASAWIFFQWPLMLPSHGVNIRSDQQRQKDSLILYSAVMVSVLLMCRFVEPLKELFQTHRYLFLLILLTGIAFPVYGALPDKLVATNTWLFSYLPTLLLIYLFYRAFNERLYNANLYFPKLAVLLLCGLALLALFLGIV